MADINSTITYLVSKDWVSLSNPQFVDVRPFHSFIDQPIHSFIHDWPNCSFNDDRPIYWLINQFIHSLMINCFITSLKINWFDSFIDWLIHSLVIYLCQTAAYWLSFCFRRVDKSRSNICFILYIFTFWWIFQDRNRKQNCKIFICSLIIVIWMEVICSSVARGFQILCSNGKVVVNPK